jgi:hypothetical protein
MTRRWARKSQARAVLARNPSRPGSALSPSGVFQTEQSRARAECIGKRCATREDLSRKSTVSRELVADYWMEGL